MSSDVREVRLPAQLCIDAERRFAARFGSVEELLVHVLQELLRDKAAQMDESERRVIEQRLKDLEDTSDGRAPAQGEGCPMLKAGLRKLLGRKPALPEKTFSFTRPLVLLQSDDWGRVGVRDREGYELLRHSEVHLGENPYDYYSLETAEDVIALRDLLKRHRDSTGRPACMVMNFLLANLDFKKIADTGFEQIHLFPLSQGLPGDWKRPGLFEAYRQGISDDVFYPALHGLTHFCRAAVEPELTLPGERNHLLRTLWKAETPYIYWRMPWIGYEYCSPEKPQAGFLDAETQNQLISEAAREFEKVFSVAPLTAVAPGYRAND